MDPGNHGLIATDTYQMDYLTLDSRSTARPTPIKPILAAEQSPSPIPLPEGPMVKIRRAYEVLFLGLFLFFLFITDLRYLKGWPVSLFLEATPLVAVATALTTHTIYRNLVWGLVIIAVTMMLGRVWCNWMCPFGILHHFFGWIGNRRNTKQMIEINRYRKIYAIKYYILAVMIAMASLWIIPTAIDSPGQIWQAYQGAELQQKGVSRVVAAIETGIARSPRSTSEAIARCKSASWTRSLSRSAR